MNKINQEVGKKVRTFRKCKGMTVQQLANIIYKSKATVSKYESGDIAIDVVMLYKIADALNIQVEQLLYLEPRQPSILIDNIPSTFFKNSTRFYSYFYDGRNNKLVKCVVDILAQPDTNRYKTMIYMNVRDFKNYQECENTYWGYTEHYDTLTTIILKNQATPLENITINILASFLESEKKWGLMSGVSFRPFMPIALKMLFSKMPLAENQELINELKISKHDIRIMKIYNMLSIT
ncbi:helix-turn-helix transcriptional regulator (plasmid) [Priestia megaterium]|uniref:helix-turn-helix domain-containing protein n=1 Tax=Priestia megaterium TaxID=1404 RepID=UPI002ACD34DB|nr:helix-turn-helix transcriptional regulator [Priestia megaterium]